MTKPTIKARDRDTILNALRAGVVPRMGLQHIQVGRKREFEAIIASLAHVSNGGAALRFIIGDYGAGKTFFLFMVRQLALAQNFVVMQADLTPERRLYATGGQARALYAALAGNVATKSTPDGEGMRNVLERFVSRAMDEARKKNTQTASEIEKRLANLREMPGGYDFARVVEVYAKAYEDGSDEKMSAVLRWLRAEYTAKTDARHDLGVRTIIDDHNFYESLKLFARFVQHAGYAGLIVCLDELVNLYKLQSAQSRKQNYEQILAIYNDVLQGTAKGIGVVLGGTPEFLMDTRRGLYSYEALQSRLAANSFASEKLSDYSGPIIHLPNLTREEMRVLLERIRSVFAGGDVSKIIVPDEALDAFMRHCQERIGEAYFRTPRMTIKSFVDFLSVLDQNPGTRWQSLLEMTEIEADRPADAVFNDMSAQDDELTSLRL